MYIFFFKLKILKTNKDLLTKFHFFFCHLRNLSFRFQYQRSIFFIKFSFPTEKKKVLKGIFNKFSNEIKFNLVLKVKSRIIPKSKRFKTVFFLHFLALKM